MRGLRILRFVGAQRPGSIDVVELDAASHGGVDDTCELRDRASYAPVQMVPGTGSTRRTW